ncbi:hypothetical protein AB0B28_06500 [Glycomyces sp. NPDC046736]|uniref:hypothetical protein n=1 Tax=Glycomyces sp. NPDC046736 TaxID=3155615 RepID=UPI0033CE38C8
MTVKRPSINSLAFALAFFVAISVLSWVFWMISGSTGSSKALTVFAASVGIVGALSSIAGIATMPRRDAKTAKDHEAALRETCQDSFRRILQQQWSAEAITLGLRPNPVRIKLSLLEKLGDTRASKLARKHLQSNEITVSDLPLFWNNLIHPRRLYIVGEPGSGKTSAAIFLTDYLSHSSESTDPFPVYLNMASWDGVSGFREWIITSATKRFPVLATKLSDRTVAEALYDENLIVPVLDGLDELASQELRATALRALYNVATSSGIPFILTSQSCVANDSSNQIGLTTPNMVAMAMQPIDPSEVIEFLTMGQLDDGHWDGVASEIANPFNPVAQCLTNPLMAFLCKQSYQDRSTNPEDLLQFNFAHEVEMHLITGFLPAKYGKAAKHVGRDSKKSHPYSWPQALQWLTFLAEHLQRDDRSIDWWRLPTIRRHRVWVGGIESAVLAVASCMLTGLILGGILAYTQIVPDVETTGEFATIMERGRARFQDMYQHAHARGLEIALSSLVAGLLVVISMSGPFALLFGLPTILINKSREKIPVQIGFSSKSFRQAMLYVNSSAGFWIIGSSIGGLFLAAFFGGLGEHLFGDKPTDITLGDSIVVTACGLILGVIVTIWVYVFGIIGQFGRIFATPAHEARNFSSARASVRDGRSATILSCSSFFAVGFTIVASIALPLIGWQGAIVLATAFGLSAALLGIFYHDNPWPRYKISLLVASGQWSKNLPRNFIEFLEDAHRRGVLRQVGASYQFRHQLIQEYLIRRT